MFTHVKVEGSAAGPPVVGPGAAAVVQCCPYANPAAFTFDAGRATVRVP
jgi:hypothetical protein